VTNATTHCSQPFQLFYERADFAVRGSGISAVTLETVAFSSSGRDSRKAVFVAGRARQHNRYCGFNMNTPATN
jgi:hypothetical protein